MHYVQLPLIANSMVYNHLCVRCGARREREPFLASSSLDSGGDRLPSCLPGLPGGGTGGGLDVVGTPLTTVGGPSTSYTAPAHSVPFTP
jgi:hypothetical protein